MKQILRTLVVSSVAIMIGATANASTCLSTQDVTLTIGTPKTVTLTSSYQMGPGSWSYQSVSPYSDISVGVTFKLQDGTTLPMGTMSIWLNGGPPFESGGSGSGSFSWNSATPMSYSNPVTEMVLTATSGTATGNVTIGDLSLTSNVGCTQPVSSSSSSSSASTPATASTDIIQSDITRVTRSSITASNSMMSSGIARLIEQRQANGNVVSSNASALSLTPRFNVTETGGLFAGGSLFGDTMTAGGVYRRITTGEFDIQKETGTGTTLSFNGRMAWERSLNEQTVLGYFIGVEGNDSNLTSTFAGDHKRLAGSAGIYALTELTEGVFAAGYGSLGIAQSDLDVTDGTVAVAGDYTYNTMALGGQLSGSIKQEAYELQPTLSVNYSKSFVGDISLTKTTSGTASALAVAVGNTEFAELIASPRFLIPVAMTEDSTFTTVGVVAPRLLCEYSKSAGSSVSNCGGGLELGLNGVSKNGMVNFNAGLRFDRINGADRQALSLQGTMEF